MIKDFVTYDQAIKLRELKFNDQCFSWYADEQDLCITSVFYDKNGDLRENNPDPTNQYTYYAFGEKSNLSETQPDHKFVVETNQNI